MNDSLAALQVALAGRYTIERELGRGGMAIVYLAHDLRLDRRVALKFLRPETAGAIGPDRFQQEIHIAAGLQHPHILSVHDSGEAAGRLFYVMPYVEGESLRDRLARERQLPIDVALRITRDVADGLSYAHSRGVVHRDINPANILLAGDHALIADFGIARALSAATDKRITGPGLTIGTPIYMSPEQAAGDEIIDARSDVYALAAVLYEMLTGEPPFNGPTPQAVLARILQEAPPPPRAARPSVPRDVERAVLQALAKVPADRFPTALQFAEALGPVHGATPPRRLGIGRVALAALAVVLALVLGRAAWRRWTGGGAAGQVLDPTHIAVLYFRDASEDNSLHHVARGLTEELIDELGSVRALHLVPPSGVRPYSERSVPLDSIARALSVGTIVEGTVERPGQVLRVRVRLIDATSGEQMESRVLERPWGDLFALQRAIADSVSRFLRERLGREIRLREQRAGTQSVAAWELVRWAEEAAERGDSLGQAGEAEAASRSLAEADSLLERAEALDPRWSEPSVQRGWLARFQSNLTVDPRLPRSAPAAARGVTDWLRLGLAHADRALRIRPGDPAALELRGHLWLSLAQSADSLDANQWLTVATQDLQAAVAADPRLARAWQALSFIQYQKGEFTDAALMLQKALETDAYLSESAPIAQLLMFASLERGDARAASAWCDTSRARFPGDFRFAECELVILGWTGSRASEAARGWGLLRDIERRDTAKALAQGWAVRRLMVAAVLARAGLADSAKSVVRRTRAELPTPGLETRLGLYEGYVYTLLGERRQALAALQEYLRLNPRRRSYVASTRWFDPLHGDPAFDALVRDAPSPR